MISTLIATDSKDAEFFISNLKQERIFITPQRIADVWKEVTGDLQLDVYDVRNVITTVVSLMHSRLGERKMIVMKDVFHPESILSAFPVQRKARDIKSDGMIAATIINTLLSSIPTVESDVLVLGICDTVEEIAFTKDGLKYTRRAPKMVMCARMTFGNVFVVDDVKPNIKYYFNIRGRDSSIGAVDREWVLNTMSVDYPANVDHTKYLAKSM